ncbi:hypothetical protein J2W91_002925 [Paenibacillus amylolyticus]|uniref:DUF3221 domain-containing protein n=1 Tax=Paenibacillus amylolyticus TaxID=1451 RepID=A0AAP5H262_PAEAM|nr:DUF3221 domain-containing protein [Paenibacillus amylolyticus]MDR6724457.1 hypothetical protein [Paenibacillus amylolyticus]
MAKLVSGLTFVLVLILTIGCSSQNEQTQSDANIIGTIIEVSEQDHQILIEQNNADDSATNLIWISQDQDSEIIVAGVAKTKFEKSFQNKKVEVWIKNLIAQSSPPQALADKVKID